MKRIAVFGAGGFVGTALVERLTSQGYHVKPLINSGRNAWRLARLGLEMSCVDVLDPTQVAGAISDCSHVVNCIMGSDRVMLDGLRNLLTACERARVQRFVHLSSITVYGEPPPPESIHEDAVPQARKGTYGGTKRQQDDMVEKCAARGLSCAILCPPIVTGPYSTQLLCLVDAIRRGRFAMVGDGENPCSLVDVGNLAQGIQLALEAESVVARRLFIVDEHCATWRELLDAIAPLLARWYPLPRLTAAEALRQINAPIRPRGSLIRTVRHLASSQVRTALRADPLYATVESWLSRTARRTLPTRYLTALRKSRKANRKSEAPSRMPEYDRLFLARQLRGVRHSSNRAREQLRYEPEISFGDSMEQFCDWYSGIHGWKGPTADLVRELESVGT